MLRNYWCLAAAGTKIAVVVTGFVDLPAVAVAAEVVTVGLLEKATAAAAVAAEVVTVGLLEKATAAVAAISADTANEVDDPVGSDVMIVGFVAAAASEMSYVATIVGMIVAFVYAAADASVQG